MVKPTGWPIRYWHLQSREIKAEFIAECMKLWDQGKDTSDISKAVSRPESIVYTAIRIGREQRRMGGTGNAESAFAKEKDSQWT